MAEIKQSKRGGARNGAGRKPKASSDEPAKMGRPSHFTQDIADRICLMLAEGKTLTKICDMADMPDRSTEWRWRQAREDYRNAVARAREERAHAWAEEVVDITDDCPVDTASVAKARLRVDARLKIMAKHAPSLYGDKASVEVTGKDGGPVVTEVRRVIVDPANA